MSQSTQDPASPPAPPPPSDPAPPAAQQAAPPPPQPAAPPPTPNAPQPTHGARTIDDLFTRLDALPETIANAVKEISAPSTPPTPAASTGDPATPNKGRSFTDWWFGR